MFYCVYPGSGILLDISQFLHRFVPVKLPPFILASASPRRAELLRQLKLEFEVIPSDANFVL